MQLLNVLDFNLYLNNEPLVKAFNLTLNENEIVGISAPSGKGKTSILNFIAGILKSSENFTYSGKIELSENVKISYGFQDNRLIPHLSVYKNLEIPSSILKKDLKAKIIDVSKNLKIQEKLYDYPEKLSGGQQQRSGLARAIIYPFDILLLDEPFSFQDKETKEEIMKYVKNYIKENKKSAILVSHNKAELDFMCDRIIKL